MSLSLPALPRLRLPRPVRRHRRLVAAGLAALAVLLVGVGIRPAAPAAVADANGVRVPAGMVAVPVTLADSAVAGLLHAGERVDLVALPADGDGSVGAHIVATDVVVLDPGSSSGFLGSGGTSTLLVATDEANAVSVAAAGARGVTVIVHPAE